MVTKFVVRFRSRITIELRLPNKETCQLKKKQFKSENGDNYTSEEMCMYKYIAELCSVSILYTQKEGNINYAREMAAR